ncbi:hypothetical protein ACFC4C_33490 [Streptomyces sp. NPDC056039]|uniref:hypothetical protein n=1 Tax=Streptomyces sp. NPDC056039 TaxID=3345687 RepID=UPI0035DAF545
MRTRLPSSDERGAPRWPALACRYGFDPRRPVQWEWRRWSLAELQRLVPAAVAPYADRDALARQVVLEEEQRRA